MSKIKVVRYLQDPAFCSVAACSCVTNSWNKNVDYLKVKEIALKKISKNIGTEGLSSGEICRLLNLIGFKKVTLVSSNLRIFDYSWERYKKKKLLKTLEESYKIKKDKDKKYEMKDIIRWYKDKNYENEIIIDYHFGDYIKEYIKYERPLIITFNWTMFFRFSKEEENEVLNPVNGDATEHAVTVYGCDSRGVNICDSHHKCYKYSRKKYRSGFYRISWERLMSVMGQGDLIIPDNYEETLM